MKHSLVPPTGGKLRVMFEGADKSHVFSDVMIRAEGLWLQVGDLWYLHPWHTVRFVQEQRE